MSARAIARQSKRSHDFTRLTSRLRYRPVPDGLTALCARRKIRRYIAQRWIIGCFQRAGTTIPMQSF